MGCDAGTRLHVQIQVGNTQIESRGRHRGRNGKTKCTLGGAECESALRVSSV